MKKAFTLIELLVVISIVAIIAAMALHTIGGPGWGFFPFGPTRTVTATVQRLYVDTSSHDKSTSSHYMVGTDKGVYEVDNSWWIGIWNADEIYSRLQQGHTYMLTTKGNKVVNMWMQQYPGIIAVTEITNESKN